MVSVVLKFHLVQLLRWKSENYTTCAKCV